MAFIERSESDSDLSDVSGKSITEAQDFSFYLDISVDQTVQDCPHNQIADPKAKIVKLEVSKPTRYHVEQDETVELTSEEMEEIAYPFSNITLLDPKTEFSRSYQSANGSYFSVSDFCQMVKDFETENRPLTRWFDGIDLHHTVFDGLVPVKDDIYSIQWTTN